MPRHFEAGDQESQPVTFDYRGKVYRCKGETPALVILRGMRAQMNGELAREATDQELLEMLEAIFEDGELDRLLRTGIALSSLFGIANRVMDIYNGKEPDDEGEAVPPEPGATTSSASSSIAST